MKSRMAVLNNLRLITDMEPPRPYLVDYLIEYARENGVTFARAAKLLAEFAKQRAPEKEIEEKTSAAQSAVRSQVLSSPSECFVARFLVRRRVHYVRRIYYPEFHVVHGPKDFWWSTIRYDKPWRPKKRPKHFYLDDLFHDGDREQFWMAEPYLVGLPESQALYAELTKGDFEKFKGTDFRKIDPRLVEPFKRARAKSPEYARKRCETDEIWDRRPYGSRGWKKRVALVPATYKRIRLR